MIVASLDELGLEQTATTLVRGRGEDNVVEVNSSYSAVCGESVHLWGIQYLMGTQR